MRRETFTEYASIEGPPLPPVHGPTEPVQSVTGSDVLLQGGRNVARRGHSPDVIGNQGTAGAPTGWASTLPDPTALPQSDVKVGRNKRGTTLRTRGLWPTHKVTVGDPHYVDPVLDLVATLTSCTEIDLQRAADALLSHADPEGWPRLLGSGRGHSGQLPERIPTDRGSGGATSSDDDDWVDPGAVLDGMRLAAAAGVLHRRPVVHTTYSSKRGKRVTTTTVEDLGNDQPGPRPVTLPLTSDRNGASVYGDSGTSIRDQHRARVTIRRANRLRACLQPKTHRKGCVCNHRAHGIAVLGTSVTFDERGTAREVQLLGRREATATRVVGWADGGYWLGHTFVRDAVRKPSVVKVAQNRASDAARKRKARAAARASDAARLDAILGATTA